MLRRMTDLNSFLERCQRHCDASGQSWGGLSRELFGKSNRLDQLKGGSDIGVLRLARASKDLDTLMLSARSRAAVPLDAEQAA